MYYLLWEWRVENYVSIRLFYFLIENSILAPCTIFIGLNFHTIHKVFCETIKRLHYYIYIVIIHTSTKEI